MQIKYSELEMHDKVIIVERLAKRFTSRQMYIDEWMRANDPTVSQPDLHLETIDIEKLQSHLRSLQ
jgi:hypothetical protein